MSPATPAAPGILATLRARADEIATSRAALGGSHAAHQALLERLDVNRRAAVRQGWTACMLERAGGMGPVRMLGIPPGGSVRVELPDQD
ncbi:hypothetical protein [Roseisolibacter sp. H3M3-2]|uniref:hypothetical protein n=1 Tax=Roseisolibacter sp. H3M3-2 TaxID=3031323 RepID=UPI0023DB59F8|nr:hypothetical protein [Roseisolibacter sp. H3M3-2]MDF1504869.1 hypothetical protein [Roseisolibacter sp. H3M3-2]